LNNKKEWIVEKEKMTYVTPEIVDFKWMDALGIANQMVRKHWRPVQTASLLE